METIYKKIAELQSANQPFVLSTLTNVSKSVPQILGAKMVVLSNGKIFGTIGGGTLEKTVIIESLKLLKKQKNIVLKKTYDLTKKSIAKNNVALGMLCGGQAEVMYEAFYPILDLVICGAGHIAQKLSLLSDMLEISYAVIDNRKDFATKERFPNASYVICNKFSSGISELPINNQTAIVIVTYGHLHDYECLESAIKTSAYYIGMIGSESKVKVILEKLKKQVKKLPNNIYSPIGLDIMPIEKQALEV
ncbi:MAG: XdhC/CoxI family protein, partial [Endomicrobiia bacterium]